MRVALDDRERLLHCHHEKLVVVDDEVAFVGGVDLTDLGGDRWDTPQHPARGRLGWHDAGSRLRGPIVADVAEHLDLRWTEVTGERAARRCRSPRRAGDTTIQLLRTVPERVYDRMRDGAFGILEGYMRALRAARELVYLESQFFWLPEIVRRCSASKLRDPPSDRFRVVVLLPSKANNGEEDTRGMLAHLADADAGRGRFLATTIDAMTGSTVDQLYVHAKVGIVDDRWLTIGSANLNAHSFFNDTEVNVQVCDPRARARDAAAPVERAPRAARGRDRRGPDGRRRSALDPDRPARARAQARGRRPRAPPPRAHARARARSSGCSGRWTRSSSTRSATRALVNPARITGVRTTTAATIADVAARAGVGASTVSRVLNGGQVSGRARARVLAAIDDLEYRPRASARSLVTGSTQTLALVIPFFTHPSAVERVRGVLAAVDETDYDLVICNVATPARATSTSGPGAPLDRSDGLLLVSLAPREDEVDASCAPARPSSCSTPSIPACRACASTTSPAACSPPAT